MSRRKIEHAKHAVALPPRKPIASGAISLSLAATLAASPVATAFAAETPTDDVKLPENADVNDDSSIRTAVETINRSLKEQNDSATLKKLLDQAANLRDEAAKVVQELDAPAAELDADAQKAAEAEAAAKAAHAELEAAYDAAYAAAASKLAEAQGDLSAKAQEVESALAEAQEALEAAKATKNEQEAALAKAVEAEAAAKALYDQAAALSEVSAAELTDAEKAYNEAKSAYDTAVAREAAASAAFKKAKEAETAAKSDRDAAQSKLVDLKSAKEDAESKLAQAREELESAQDALAAIEAEGDAGAAEALDAKIASLTAEIATLDESLTETETSISLIKTDAAKADSAIAAAQAEADELKSAYDAYQATLKSETYRNSAAGFFEYMIANTTDAAERAEWEMALNILLDPDNPSNMFIQKASYVKSVAAYVDLESKKSSTYLNNVMKSLDYIDESNEIRKTTETCWQKNKEVANFITEDMRISPIFMAIAMVQTDASCRILEKTGTLNHTLRYGGGENLSYGYADPFQGWYTEEKLVWESMKEGIATAAEARAKYGDYFPGTKTKITDDMWIVGHYVWLVESTNEVTGFAVYNGGKAWKIGHGQVFGDAAASKRVVTMTTDDFRALIDEYTATLAEEPQCYTDWQNALVKVEELTVQKQNDLEEQKAQLQAQKQKAEQEKAAVEESKATLGQGLPEARQAVEAKRAAAESAQVAADAAAEKHAAGVAALQEFDDAYAAAQSVTADASAELDAASDAKPAASIHEGLKADWDALMTSDDDLNEAAAAYAEAQAATADAEAALAATDFDESDFGIEEIEQALERAQNDAAAINSIDIDEAIESGTVRDAARMGTVAKAAAVYSLDKTLDDWQDEIEELLPGVIQAKADLENAEAALAEATEAKEEAQAKADGMRDAVHAAPEYAEALANYNLALLAYNDAKAAYDAAVAAEEQQAQGNTVGSQETSGSQGVGAPQDNSGDIDGAQAYDEGDEKPVYRGTVEDRETLEPSAPAAPAQPMTTSPADMPNPSTAEQGEDDLPTLIYTGISQTGDTILPGAASVAIVAAAAALSLKLHGRFRKVPKHAKHARS